MLKTYSKRGKPSVEALSRKSRRVLEIDDIAVISFDNENVYSREESQHLSAKSPLISRDGKDKSLAKSSPKADSSYSKKTNKTSSDSNFQSSSKPSFGKRNSEESSPTALPFTDASHESLSMNISSEKFPVSPIKTATHSTTQELSRSRLLGRELSGDTSLAASSSEFSDTPIYSSHSRANISDSIKSWEGGAEINNINNETDCDNKNSHKPTSIAGVRSGDPNNLNIPASRPSNSKKRGVLDLRLQPSSTVESPHNREKSSEPIVTQSTIARKRGLDESDAYSPATSSAPSIKKPRLSNIQNYFKPLPRSSSPLRHQSALNSSDSIQAPQHITPPSSPPLVQDSNFTHPKKSEKRQPRRLTTKPTLEPLDHMSRRDSRSSHFADDDDRPQFSEVVGGADDPAGISLVEEYMDEDEKDDLHRSQLVSPGNRGRHWFDGAGSSRHTSSSLPNPPLEGPSSPRPSANNAGRTRGASFPSNVQGGRSVRPSPLRASRIASYSEAGPSSPYNQSNDFQRHRSATVGNFNLYSHDERRESNPLQALSDRWYDQGLAPYRPSHTMPIPTPPKKRSESSGYQQLQLDLGISQSINCAKCKMLYNPSEPMDKRAHDEFCRSTSLPELPKRLTNDRALCERIVHGEQHQIRVFGRHSSPAQRLHAQQVLDATYTDLEGLRYTEDELAAEVRDPLTYVDPGMVPRFKLYVYYIGRKVIGALLVERYHQFESQALVERSGRGPMLKKHVVFDRLWVAAPYRRLGYAKALADNARSEFIPGLRLPKEAVAMPEQTEMGRGFARRYFCT